MLGASWLLGVRLGVTANGRMHWRLVLGVAGSTIHAWNSRLLELGVDGTLLPWLQWSDACSPDVERGSGLPPRHSSMRASILGPEMATEAHELMWICS